MSPQAAKIIKNSYTKSEAWTQLEEERLSIQKNGKDDVLSKVEQEIDQVPELVIFTAGELSEEQKKEVGQKARELFGRNLPAGRQGIFLDFKVNPALLAGAAVSFGGEYRDYSLKAKFEEKKEEIQEIYKKFLITNDQRPITK